MADEEKEVLQKEEAPPPIATEEIPPAPAEVTPVVDEPPDPAALKAEIEALRKQREEAEKEAIRWRREKAQARADFFKDRERPAEPPPVVPPVGDPPKASQFDDYDAFVRAQAAYETEQRVRALKAQWEAESAKQREQDTFRQRMETLEHKLEEGYRKYADFEDVVRKDETVPITQAVANMLADCDHPADIAYYLAKNRTEGIRIARLARENPALAGRELTKLELRLQGEPNPQPAPRKVSAAPPPITPVGSRGEIAKNPETMTAKEFEEFMIKRGAKRY